MKKITTLLSSIFFIALTGCEENIQNGIIPEQYRAEAQKYTGTYAGEMDGQTVYLNFSIQENGFVEISSKQQDGSLGLVKGCPTQFGPLVSIKGKNNTQQLELARFQFDGKSCGFVAVDIVVYPDAQKIISLEIAKKGHYELLPPHCAPNGRCRVNRRFVVDEWLTGSFEKIN